ncbi:MAG: hypothetical protein GOVbin2917_31 [Prokaryotic dsDNA virus sp.]|jgi:hypothetical protein|nr:MAG: hypothetical protein GOVbin2917_31 [Prokaryotic dsDNA virus sp.]|tara:strand:+ start:182 stop:451 length:270 start_codon:yes stop_codon:yes gene_type:complete
MINFYKQKVVDVEYTVSVEDFVLEHLEEVRPWGDEYDFYVQDSVNSGYLSRVMSLKKKDCPIEDLSCNDSIIKGLRTYYENKPPKKLSQ